MKKPLIVIGLLILLPSLFLTGVIVGAVRITNIQANQAKGSLTKPTLVYEPSREMVGLARKVGIPDSYLYATQAQFGIGQGNVCDPKIATACYDPNTRIIHLYIAVFTNPNEDAATDLGYEMGHYVWQDMAESEKVTYRPMLTAIYQISPPIFKSYIAPVLAVEGGLGSDAFYDEMHSSACTQISDRYLPPALLAHCSTYLPIRSALKNIY